MSPSPCFCHVLLPLLRVSQFLGLLPLTLVRTRCCKSKRVAVLRFPALWSCRESKHGETSLGDDASTTESCQFVHKWISWPSLMNAVWIFVYLLNLVWVHTKMFELLRRFFTGTDLYAIYLQVCVVYYEVIVLLVITRWKSNTFSKAWSLLAEVSSVLTASFRRPVWKPVAVKMRLLLVVVVISTMAYVCIAIGSGIQAWTTKKPEYILDFSLLGGYLWQKFVQNFLVLFYQMVAVLLLALCLIIRLLNTEISAWLQHELAQPTSPQGSMTERVGRVRQVHAKLCRAISMVSDVYGLQTLTVICSLAVSLTMNIYKLIHSKAPFLENEALTNYYYLWGYFLYFGVFTMTVSLVAGQVIADLKLPSHEVVYEGKYTALDAETKFEVLLYVDQVAKTPKITAMGITDISAGILGSLVTTVATYLLVLLQFKSGFPGKEVGDEG